MKTVKFMALIAIFAVASTLNAGTGTLLLCKCNDGGIAISNNGNKTSPWGTGHWCDANCGSAGTKRYGFIDVSTLKGTAGVQVIGNLNNLATDWYPDAP